MYILVPFNGGEIHAHSGSIRMEGMQSFASKIRKFCIHIGRKTLTHS